LDAAAGCRTVILQGESASIYPLELLRRGVSVVCTTLKPPNLVDLADLNRLPSVLEGGLPSLFLSRCVAR
jgi:hypothetical protein